MLPLNEKKKMRKRYQQLLFLDVEKSQKEDEKFKINQKPDNSAGLPSKRRKMKKFA